MKSVCSLLISIILTVLSVTWGSAGQQPESPAASPVCLSHSWPHELSDLPPDPNLHFGRLENGLRYVILKNKEPKDRVAVYLDVQVGSLQEQESERGLAHFLEHMMFNGSKHFPPGKLVEFFQSIGMSFGGDTNAHTSYDETVYKLILPGGSSQQLRQGLTVMADFARGASLLENEIERERGVILAEKRSGDSAGYRTMVARNRNVYRGTRMAERLPIGDEKVLATVDRKLMQNFYNAWYRPENMVLVVVGDMIEEELKALIREIFSPLQSDGKPPVCPDFGALNHGDVESFYHFEHDLGYTVASVETFWNRKKQNDSIPLREDILREDLGMRIMNHRLQKLQESGTMPFTGINYFSGTMQYVGYGSISARTDAHKWPVTLKTLQAYLQQALDHGFSEDELQRVKKEAEAALDAQMLTADTRNSQDLATAIIRDLNDNRVYQSPEQEKVFYSERIQNMTAAEVTATFRAVWGNRNRVVSLTGNAVLPAESAEKQILAEYRQALQQKLAAPARIATTVFPYLSVPAKTSPPVAVQSYKAIDAEQLEFANGVVVNLKKTSFEENTLRVRLDFGEGKRDEPKPGLALLAEKVINDSGSGRLQNSELEEILAGSTIKADFRVSEESFTWEGSALGKDSELLFQVLDTMLRDPGMKDDAYHWAMQGITQMYDRLQSDVNGAFPMVVESFLAGNDKRFGLPLRRELQALQLADVHRWMLPEFQRGRMEISIVGDFQRDRIVALASRYFGSLAPREKRGGQVVPPVFPIGGRLHTSVPTATDKAMVVVAWPTADFWDIRRTRRLQILANILQDRLRDVVREKLGATYSPSAYSSGSKAYPGYGILLAQMVVDPSRAEEITREIEKIVGQLHTGGVTVEELDRAKGPMLTSLKETIRNNRYWLHSVLALSSRHPQQLEWPDSIMSDYVAITAGEISSLAATYLSSMAAASVVVLPATDK